MTVSSHGDSVAYYALRPKAPVRAVVLAAVLAIAGAVLCWLGWPEPRNLPLGIAGAVAAAVGVALGIAAVAFVSSGTLHIVLSDDGFDVSGPGYHKGGAWIDVTGVSATPDGSRLVIAQGLVDRTFIQCPGGVADERMRALTLDVSARLAERAA